ncbi:SDR family NAD(P)-dependent oxidoreductase [Sphingomonas baiyangensis]|uniref:SDR family oxidoreductase n=1 Tax=Sphingomonas baiyangensis TaxID=2572576 RepID=A0A4U1L4I2_9SPHN|nr:SDR family oxidoreductase [Sphingomonas baiyangensis]TKD51831.1 SDR family oxidoreductase [Sphingomonas baiyangensis]
MVGEAARRVALVTGAAGGIGSAVARALVAEGHAVALADRAAPDALAHELGNGAIALACDLGDPARVASLVDTVVARCGRIDLLVNVAGMMIFKPLTAHDAADWQALLAVNLVAPALLTGAAMRYMASGGAIVNVASVHAQRTSPIVGSYAASKAALVSLTRTTAIEGRDRGIRCNAILPGAIDTLMLRESPNIKSGAEIVDPADIGTPEDIAALALFLASDAARFITGEAIVADGGRMGRL